MLRGIYTAANAMTLSMEKMNIFAQNVSNANTTGYKKKNYVVHSFPDVLVQMSDKSKAPLAQGSYLDQASVDHKQGVLRRTGNSLDLAIKDIVKEKDVNGVKQNTSYYFQLMQGPRAKDDTSAPRYTISRNGNFMINHENYLVNSTGDYVLDTQNNRIRLVQSGNPQNPNPPATQELSMAEDRIRIDQWGRIFDTTKPNNTQPIAQIKIVEWTDQPEGPQEARDALAVLKRRGIDVDRGYRELAFLNPLPPAVGNDPNQPPLFSIHQGNLEESNVNMVTSMIEFMMTSKDYDMSQKLITTEDKVLDKSINEMGRLQ